MLFSKKEKRKRKNDSGGAKGCSTARVYQLLLLPSSLTQQTSDTFLTVEPFWWSIYWLGFISKLLKFFYCCCSVIRILVFFDKLISTIVIKVEFIICKLKNLKLSFVSLSFLFRFSFVSLSFLFIILLATAKTSLAKLIILINLLKMLGTWWI